MRLPCHTWLVSDTAEEFTKFLPIGTKATKVKQATSVEAIFKLFSLGVLTARDEWIYDFASETLSTKVLQIAKNYNYEVYRLSLEASKLTDIDAFVNNDPTFLKWTDRLKTALLNGTQIKFEQDKIRMAMYRPFVKERLYFDHLLIQRRYQQHYIFPTSVSEQQNRAIVLTTLGSEKPFMLLMAGTIVDYHLVGAGCGTQCFPFYTYSEDGTKRRENITDWSLQQFRQRYDDSTLDKWDIFYYIYGLLHHPGYRERFADNLKRYLPHIPFAPDFWPFATSGRELASLHLEYEKLEPYPLDWIETTGMPLSYRVEDKMRLSKDKTSLVVNPSLKLAGIPPEAFRYTLGNRSALEWVIDQYQVSEDKRSGIRSDPNRPYDKQYIVNLVGQVIQVSLKTIASIDQLPEEFM
jgi:predicted helicase